MNEQQAKYRSTLRFDSAKKADDLLKVKPKKTLSRSSDLGVIECPSQRKLFKKCFNRTNMALGRLINTSSKII